MLTKHKMSWKSAADWFTICKHKKIVRCNSAEWQTELLPAVITLLIIKTQPNDKNIATLAQIKTGIHRHQTLPWSRNSATCAMLCEQAECVHAYSPLRPKVTSSIKPEVHNVAQRPRRTEPWPQRIRTQNFVKIGPAVPEICLRTDRQTGWSQYSAPLPARRGG